MAAGHKSSRGVGYDEVAHIAQQIVEEGRTPTVRSVRGELGTGSNATILTHLNAWKARREQAAKDQATILPDGVVSAIREAIDQAVRAARTELAARLGEAQVQIGEDQQLLADAEARLERLEASLAEAEKRAAADQQRIEGLQERLQQGEVLLAEERQARDRLQVELAQARERIKMVGDMERQLAEERGARLDAEKRASAAQARLEALSPASRDDETFSVAAAGLRTA
jgi:chromosome segregation ATPase